MATIAKDSATPQHIISHSRKQRRFNQHRDKFDKHREKGPAFAKALDDLEESLFGPPYVGKHRRED